MDDGEEKTAVRTSRLRILAVRELGYTHEEYGKRTLSRITEELEAAAEMRQKPESSVDDSAWIDEEAI